MTACPPPPRRSGALLAAPVLFFVFVFVFVSGIATAPAIASPPPGFTLWQLSVDGLEREAWARVPAGAKERPVPVVFVFHGHGGRMEGAARGFRLHEEWPEALVVYPQGVNTPGRLTDPDGTKPGWQAGPGDHGDRDLKFFDALVERARREARVDERHVHATGHSNGGGFTYLLWSARGDVLASVAPSAAAGARRLRTSLRPLPVLHLAGENDPLVKFAWQEASIAAVKAINGCTEPGQPWAPGCTRFPSPGGTPLVTFIHPGGHEFPREAPALIARFFREHGKPAPAGP
jgi:polyhydroxybutyrate depolymerase